MIEKDEAALDAALTIETCRTEMASAAEDWASARIQTLILTHVARRQRLESTNPLLSAAEAYFTSLTCGRYRKLFISEDSKTPELAALLHDEKHDEKTVRPSAMSEARAISFISVCVWQRSIRLNHVGSRCPLSQTIFSSPLTRRVRKRVLPPCPRSRRNVRSSS